jgi:hypothetical protein
MMILSVRKLMMMTMINSQQLASTLCGVFPAFSIFSVFLDFCNLMMGRKREREKGRKKKNVVDDGIFYEYDTARNEDDKILNVESRKKLKHICTHTRVANVTCGRT